MSAFTHTNGTEIQFGSDPNHATYVSLRPLALAHAPDTVELRFETTFVKAKNPAARQTKSQHFMSTTDLRLLRDQIDVLLSTQEASGLSCNGGHDA
jgi:hypothetical protein